MTTFRANESGLEQLKQDLFPLQDYWHPLATPHLVLHFDRREARQVYFSLRLETCSYRDDDEGVWIERHGERVPLVLVSPTVRGSLYADRGVISLNAWQGEYGLFFNPPFYVSLHVRPNGNLTQPSGLHVPHKTR